MEVLISLGHTGAGKAPTPRHVVFVSHSAHDKWIARVVGDKVRGIGAEPWLYEKDLEGGSVVVEGIIRAVDACHEAIVLVSAESAKSQWVAFEIGAVRAQHKRVTPILNNVRYDAIAPIKDVKAIELNEFDEFLEQLKKRVQARVTRKRQ